MATREEDRKYFQEQVEFLTKRLKRIEGSNLYLKLKRLSYGIEAIGWVTFMSGWGLDPILDKMAHRYQPGINGYQCVIIIIGGIAIAVAKWMRK